MGVTLHAFLKEDLYIDIRLQGFFNLIFVVYWFDSELGVICNGGPLGLSHELINYIDTKATVVI